MSQVRITQQFKLLGVIFLVFLVGAVYLTYAIFSKKFVDYDRVAMQSSTIGLQLPSRADVKIRGVIVGEVLDTTADADGATLTLGLFPDQVGIIPANVTGSIVPKTLFGEKYVSLVVPSDPKPEHIEAGATITRTAVPTEVEDVLSDLYPLLRTVRPADLNTTLNAIATALEGRGEAIGQNLVTVDDYLKKMNPELPKLIDDLRLTSSVSDTYSDVLPQLATVLRNTITTTGTLEDKSAKLNAVFTNTTSFSNSARTFLEDNGDNLIRLGKVGAAQLDVLAKYSPEFPCLLGGIVTADKRQAEAFRNFTLHIVLETLPRQPRAYNAGDQPRFADDRGPNCANLPAPPVSQANPLRQVPNINDGVDESTGKGTDRVAPGFGDSGSGYGVDYSGSPQERAVLDSLLAPGLGVSAEEVPDLGALLIGPMARGAKVELR